MTRLNERLHLHPPSLEGGVFYSDSHTDLPLLELVAVPVAADPNDALRAEATRRDWEIRSMR